MLQICNTINPCTQGLCFKWEKGGCTACQWFSKHSSDIHFFDKISFVCMYMYTLARSVFASMLLCPILVYIYIYIPICINMKNHGD